MIAKQHAEKCIYYFPYGVKDLLLEILKAINHMKNIKNCFSPQSRKDFVVYETIWPGVKDVLEIILYKLEIILNSI